MEASAETIKAALTEIANVELKDFFRFEYESTLQLDQLHMEYGGCRTTLKMTYENGTPPVRDKIQFDIGVGDVVNAAKMDYEPFEYKGVPLFSGAISIQVYPIETILAEKLETIVSKAGFNSRMKDYHDVFLIIRSGLLPQGKILKTLKSTFDHRGTKFSFPLDVQQIERLQGYWSSHLKKLGDRAGELDLPKNIAVIVTEINDWKANEV
jgi:hypothetical protein